MSYDAIIIGSGGGGSTCARALAEVGKKVLVIERGSWVERSPFNWDPEEVFAKARYVSPDTWQDSHGHPFQPQVHYGVGGATKFYGAALFRMPAERLEHWAPGMCQAMDPHYAQAERWYNVHEVPDAPVVARIRQALTEAGVTPVHAPVGVSERDCIGCHLCDGFPCPLHAKMDAETAAMRPALATGSVELITGVKITRLVYEGFLGAVTALEGETISGESWYLQVGRDTPVILAAGAVNSAALWLASGIPDVSGQAGRNLMLHVNQAVLAAGRDPIPPGFHKTLLVDQWQDMLGTVQMAGQPQAAMLRGESRLGELAPGMALREIAERSVCFWLITEDMPLYRNQVTVDGGKIRVAYEADHGAWRASEDLYRELRRLLPGMGFHAHLRKRMPLAAVAHQCGTLKLGTEPGSSVVRAEDCRAWSTGNLFVADASVFPRSSSVNPALTVMANALRVADVIAR